MENARARMEELDADVMAARGVKPEYDDELYQLAPDPIRVAPWAWILLGAGIGVFACFVARLFGWI